MDTSIVIPSICTVIAATLLPSVDELLEDSALLDRYEQYAEALARRVQEAKLVGIGRYFEHMEALCAATADAMQSKRANATAGSTAAAPAALPPHKKRPITLISTDDHAAAATATTAPSTVPNQPWRRAASASTIQDSAAASDTEAMRKWRARRNALETRAATPSEWVRIDEEREFFRRAIPDCALCDDNDSLEWHLPGTSGYVCARCHQRMKRVVDAADSLVVSLPLRFHWERFEPVLVEPPPLPSLLSKTRSAPPTQSSTATRSPYV